MKKTVLAVAVLAAAFTSTGCISKAQKHQYAQSGCEVSDIVNGCRRDKSYEWNVDHGFIQGETSSRDSERGHRGGNHHEGRNKHEDRQSHDDQSGINGKFAGNYVAKFDNGQRGAEIHVEDSGVYINGKEAQSNQVGDVLTFREGYATYTIRKHGRSEWEDRDAGNHGTIVRD